MRSYILRRWERFMSDKPLDCVGNDSGVGKHDFKLSPEQEIADLKRRVAELEDLTMGFRPIGPVRFGPAEKTDEEIREIVDKAVKHLRDTTQIEDDALPP